MVWGAADDLAQPLQRDHGDISVLFQGVQGVVVNAVLQKLILGHVVFLHRLPQRAVIYHVHHHVSCLIRKLYVEFWENSIVNIFTIL